MKFGKQLLLVLWKNWILQKRKICVTIFEILIPVFFAGLFLAIRNLIDYDRVNEPTYYDVYDAKSGVNFTNKIVGYAPDIPETSKVMTIAEALLENQTYSSGVSFRGFPTEQDALDFFKIHSKVMRHIIVFYNVDNTSIPLPKNVRFAVRPYTGDSNWYTRFTFPFFQTGGPRDMGLADDPQYERRGVLFMQRLMGESLIKYVYAGDGKDPNEISLGAYKQRMAYPPYIKDAMITIMQSYLPLFLVLSFIICVVVNTKNLVYEKERKLKESMKLMGLLPSVYWVSWFITFMIYLVPALIIYAVLMGVEVSSSNGAVLNNSNPFLFFLFLVCYGLALITFCFMVSTFVQKANVAAAMSGILFFAFYFPVFVIDNNYEDMSKMEKMSSCLLFNCALGLGAKVIGIYEGTGAGAQFNNFFDPGTVDDNLSLLDCMLMLLIDSGIHLIITWYLDNVRPGEFGVPKPFYFPFMKSYWCGNDKKADGSNYDAPEHPGSRFEKDPSNLHAGIEIKNLKKDFDKKIAVAGMTLNMYEGQISVLLGHNGAGKTTTMSMLTGFIPVTSGSAVVNGFDIRDNIEGVRSSLGLCPQHDVLFDTLTVREHLHFFAKLKGASDSKIIGEISSLVNELGIQTKINDMSRNLSGGQKRKLSVAIALIGGSKVVILDEPSSGMDPAARRQTWTVLQKHRQGRTFLLTTHYMDEADVLGDRIAIMAEGVVKCCGSSMFLKKLYGAGYHLVIVKEPSCDVDALTNVIQSHVKTSSLEGIINMEITYILPDDQSSSFPGLFEELESRKTNLGISSFGTSATTMEEVFLKVGENAFHHDDSQSSSENSSYGSTGFTNPTFKEDEQALDVNGSHIGKNKVGNNTELQSNGKDLMAFNKGFKKKTGLSLEFSQIKGLFVKKAILTWRNRTVSLVQLLLPVIFTIFGLAVDELRAGSSKSPALNFDLSPFGSTYIPCTAGNADNNTLIDLYVKQFGRQHTIEEFNRTLYGGYDNYTIKRADELGTSTFNRRMIIGLESIEKNTGESVAAIAHYNGQPFHSQPISINMMMNAFMQLYLGENYSYHSSIDPLPKDEEEDVKFDYLNSLFAGMSIGIFIVFGMAFLTTLFIYNLIKERQVGAKHMQIVSGVSPFTYWIPTFLWDFITYIIPSLLLIVVFICYSKQAFIGDGRWLLVILVLALYGWAVLPFTYALHFLFKEPPSGVVAAIMLNIVSGLVTLITVSVLKSPGLGTEDIADILDWIFIIIFPNYNMAQSFVNMFSNHISLESCEPRQPLCKDPQFRSPCCLDHCDDFDFCMAFEDNYMAWDRPGIGVYLLFMAIDGLVYSIIVLLIEYNVLTRLLYLVNSSKYSTGQQTHMDENNAGMVEDSDVAAERQRLNSSPASVLSSTDSLLLVNLFKQYGTFIAVDHICVGVPEQECFGLLGQNGAGKTTTFKMLTGDVMVTGGNAYLKGFDVRSSIKDVQANMGYCPQFDALLDQMTGRETLTMYARLRGIPEEHIRLVSNELLDIMLLKPHADKLAGKYSGGNKRKLSTAIALVGDPPFIMLDEPSAGMDPKARRQLWNVLSQVRASGRTLVLTSHSMEECDALCTRIAIMVNGSFVCLGSPQHLKNKFGQGYTLIVQLGFLEDGSTAPIEPVIHYVTQNFHGAKVFDNHQGYIHFQVPDANISLARVFSLMESIKVNLNVRDYSVHQTTLEQVFLTFTRGQQIPKEKKKSDMCSKFCCCMTCGISRLL